MRYAFPSLLFICISSSVILSCTPAYIPNVINSPMLTDAGELQAAVHTGTTGYDIQAAGSPTEHLGIIANVSLANRRNQVLERTHRHTFAEAGAGYYNRLGNSAAVFEAYAGAGLGRFKSTDWTDGIYTDVDAMITRVFVQPSLGVTTSVVDASLATRFCFLHAQDGPNGYNDVFFEPALTFKAGYKYMKGVMQVGLSVPMIAPELTDYQPFMFSVGLQATIGKKYIDNL